MMIIHRSSSSSSSPSSSCVFRLLVCILSLLAALIPVHSKKQNTASSSCSANVDAKDPNLHEISFDIGYGTEYFEVYIQPNLTSMIGSDNSSATTPATVKTPSFQGLAAKFFNMSPDTVMLYWDSMVSGDEPLLISKLTPFFTSGTASFPGHNFIITPTDYNYKTNRKILQRFVVEQGISNYYYDPLGTTTTTTAASSSSSMDDIDAEEMVQLNLATLTMKQYEMYEKMKQTQLFNLEYKKATGREYLSHYPRQKPNHFMYPADYFGQTHWVTSPEVQFLQIPEMKDLHSITTYGKRRILNDSEPRFLSQYRSTESILNMTLTVLSVAPRAFEIKNFLSAAECDHILNLAGVLNLSRSQTGDADNTKSESETRTSFNTWVTREQDYVVDAIYRRAADLLRIDEALMRFRGDGEYPDLGTENSIAESLQLVRYRDGQEYTAHHDFGYSEIDEPLQPNRFATVLFYLNDGMVGGETEFPRWVNGETNQGLRVTPEKGKAVLFYSHLPDGNMDDLSEHAALPVTEGMKFLTNLWVWDPFYEN